MKLLLKIALLFIFGTLANATEPYCTRNETTIKRVPVTKTRLVVKKPSGPFKWFKKTKYVTETYKAFEEERHIKVIHGCCDGYRMSEHRLCEPFCEQNCPEKAACVEPNVCECAVGYVTAISSIDGSHYCEPICEGSCPVNARCVEPDICECEQGYHKLHDEFKCEPRCSSGCPFGGQCISPELCTCAEGYSAELGTCVPICTAGDGCQHGKCIEPEHCVCHKGYVMNEQNQLCEEQPCGEGEICAGADESEYDEISEDTTKTVMGDDVESERMFVSASNTEDSTAVNCPPNFFFYNNVCRPKHFASNEFDCRFKPCVEHAFCQANGTCACKEGFIWYKHQSTDLFVDETSTTVLPETTENSTAVCLTPAQVQQLLETVQKSNSDDDEDPMDWMSVGVLCLGALCMLGALCFLVFKLLQRKKGKMDVEAKNDLMCSYDNKNYNSSPHVY